MSKRHWLSGLVPLDYTTNIRMYRVEPGVWFRVGDVMAPSSDRMVPVTDNWGSLDAAAVVIPQVGKSRLHERVIPDACMVYGVPMSGHAFAIKVARGVRLEPTDKGMLCDLVGRPGLYRANIRSNREGNLQIVGDVFDTVALWEEETCEKCGHTSRQLADEPASFMGQEIRQGEIAIVKTGVGRW